MPPPHPKVHSDNLIIGGHQTWISDWSIILDADLLLLLPNAIPHVHISA